MRPRSLAAMVMPALCACAGGQPAHTITTASGSTSTMSPEPALDLPATRREDVVDLLFGTRVSDPYRWLEDATNPEVKAWMQAQDRAARAYLASLPARDRLATRLRELYYYDAISPPVVRGDRLFYIRRHHDKEKAVLYWREGAEGQERVLIDPNALSEDGSISLSGWSPSPSGKYLAYKLSENNADAATLYVMEVATGKILEGDTITGARYASPSWTPDERGFFYTHLPVDPSIPVPELPGHAHINYHVIGTDPAKDPVFYPATGDPKTFVSADVPIDGSHLIITIWRGWSASDVYFKPLPEGGAASIPADRAAKGYKTLVAGKDALFGVDAFGGQFFVHTNLDAPNYRVFAVDPEHPEKKAWREIVPESDALLNFIQLAGGHLVLSYLENAHSRMAIHTLAGKRVREVKLPGIGTASGVYGREDLDTAYFAYSSFAQPTQIYRMSIASGETALWEEIELPVDTSQLAVDQVWYRSKDGTRVSMFIVHRKGTAKTGDNPTLLYGYGGFNVSLTPGFSPAIVTWVEQGGVYAIPNLRGGGEYGEDWHQAGMRENKQNVFDDFIAAAEYLVAEGWTSKDKLAIYGGSNGGLLVGAAMTQRPDLFEAVVCAVPLLDMIRYHLFGSGKTWIPEYGSAEDPEMFEVLLAYSPYHQVKAKTAYPALLMLSSDSDDRVDPMHARKFVAAIQWASSSAAPVILRIEENAGHGGADLRRAEVAEKVDLFAFLISELGMSGRVNGKEGP